MNSIKNDFPEQVNIKALNAAVSDLPGKTFFCASGNMAGHVITGGEHAKEIETKVPVLKLDDVIDEPVTILKMDIEGFEIKALRGADRLITDNQPLLAICGYHWQSDFWEIPLYMKKRLPHHHIFLRNYAGAVEYVFYAVPENKFLSE